jgi:hypothetical protein
MHSPSSAVLVTVAILALASFVTGLALAAERDPRTNFILRCSGCHGLEGTGVPNAGIPAFADVVGVFAADADGRTYLVHVPGVVGSSLTNAAIAGVMNYVMERWAGRSLPADFVPFTAEEVAARRAIPVTSVVDLRREIVARLAADGQTAAPYPWP